VPLQELAVRLVSPARWQPNDLACLGVELLAIAELLAQSRAHHEPVFGVHAQIATVENGVHVRPEQQAVVEPVLTALSHRADMRRLKHGWNMRAGDRALPLVGIQDHGLERLLAQPVRREPGITKHWPGPVPRLRQVDLHRDAEKHLQGLIEV
jgi:hypothetical protein